jgi:microcystin-dependent protein
MSCQGCFNGCTEVSSTNCNKYTGPSIPELGIETGDSLTTVITTITTLITSIITGDGIIPNIDVDDVCAVVKVNLPLTEDITLVDYLNALIQTACSFDERIGQITQELEQIETAYDVCCLTGVDANSNTHQVLQAAVKKICSISETLTEFILEVTTNYVKTSEVDALIAEYLSSQNDNTYRNRLIPYAPVPYFGPLTGFDITGVGSGLFTDIYLCNGLNGTPDLRGFTLVGATTGMGGGGLNPIVDPVSTGNPVYTLDAINGANTVTLTVQQIPSHSHTADATSTADPHSHFVVNGGSSNIGNVTPVNPIVSSYDVSGISGDRFSYRLRSAQGVADNSPTASTVVNIDTDISIDNAGGGQSHSNVQPSKGCYYIMYIP